MLCRPGSFPRSTTTRYSYNDGDRVIYILSRILHDVDEGLLGNRGSSTHRWADFIFIIPSPDPRRVRRVLDVFDTLIRTSTRAGPRAGYYFGKDRRGSCTASRSGRCRSGS